MLDLGVRIRRNRRRQQGLRLGVRFRCIVGGAERRLDAIVLRCVAVCPGGLAATVEVHTGDDYDSDSQQ